MGGRRARGLVGGGSGAGEAVPPGQAPPPARLHKRRPPAQPVFCSAAASALVSARTSEAAAAPAASPSRGPRHSPAARPLPAPRRGPRAAAVSCRGSGGAEGSQARGGLGAEPEGKGWGGGARGRVQLRAAARRPCSGPSETVSPGAALRASPRPVRRPGRRDPRPPCGSRGPVGGLARRRRGSLWPPWCRGALGTLVREDRPGLRPRPAHWRVPEVACRSLEALGLHIGHRSELWKSFHTLT